MCFVHSQVKSRNLRTLLVDDEFSCVFTEAQLFKDEMPCDKAKIRKLISPDCLSMLGKLVPSGLPGTQHPFQREVVSPALHSAQASRTLSFLQIAQPSREALYLGSRVLISRLHNRGYQVRGPNLLPVGFDSGGTKETLE